MPEMMLFHGGNDHSVLQRKFVVICLLLVFSTLRSNLRAAEEEIVLDDFSDASRWEKVLSEGVELELHAVTEDRETSQHSTSLRLDINFVRGGGYAGIRHKFPLDLPPNFLLAFSIRGELPVNNLELKLLDESGENVWWVNRRSYNFPREWTSLGSRRRHFQFAWGPSSVPLQKLSAIEIVVASAEGGRGSIWLDDLTFKPLPESKPYTGTPHVMANSNAGGSAARFAFDRDSESAWRSAANDHQPTLTIDFGQSREFGGLIVEWDPADYATQYDVQFSDDAESWTTVRNVERNSGRTQFLSLADAEASAIRFVMKGSPGKQVELREVEILPLEVSQEPNHFAKQIAQRAPRGHYPRAIRGEGTFWTLVGIPKDEHEALISEDGAVEVDKSAFSIEPFLVVDDKLLTWADAKISQSLADGFVPVPTVTREHDGLQLTITAAADGEVGQSMLLLLYALTNTTEEPKDGSMLLTLRPFQVNPPYQWLNTVGGVSHINHLELTDSSRVVMVDNRQVALGAEPDDFGAATFDEGSVVAFLGDGSMPSAKEVTDPQQAASGVIKYNFQLRPGESRSWAVCVPFADDPSQQKGIEQALLDAANPVEWVHQRQQAVVDRWRQAIGQVELLVPPEALDVVNTIRSTLAYILINQDRYAIHPGSRSYERSWIRDGSLTATALLRFGLTREAQEFVDWYAPYQFDSGKVPCVVDHRGPDPVPENDSHGQFIMAVMNVYRFTGDEEFLKRHWSAVQNAVRYIESLRAERMIGEYADPDTSQMHQEPGKPRVSLHAFYGLMPESISHEGYSAKPMHSYWDDFFTLKGLKDAAEMARILQEPATADRYQSFANDFAETLYASLNLAMKTHGIDYLPGCVELGDFDATSTTIALWPCNEEGRLPQRALENTFEQYWERFVSRRDDPSFDWIDYTPYELRVIGSFVLMNESERAQQALDFFMQDRRPASWNQWPEVVYRKHRTAKFLGDMPHTWCGSDFVNSVRMMFLFEREQDDSIVLLAGIPEKWVGFDPIGFQDMPTYGGQLSCSMQRLTSDPNTVEAKLSGDSPIPSGGLRLTVPMGKPEYATINYKPAEFDSEGRVKVKQLPAKITLNLAH